MSARFPHRGPGRHETTSTSGATSLDAPHEFFGPRLLRDDSAVVPSQACCCPAKPMVKAVMPATDSRQHPVDLWLCGHHWRASRVALAQAGATIYDVSTPSATDEHRENAPV